MTFLDPEYDKALAMYVLLHLHSERFDRGFPGVMRDDVWLVLPEHHAESVSFAHALSDRLRAKANQLGIPSAKVGRARTQVVGWSYTRIEQSEQWALDAVAR